MRNFSSTEMSEGETIMGNSASTGRHSGMKHLSVCWSKLASRLIVFVIALNDYCSHVKKFPQYDTTYIQQFIEPPIAPKTSGNCFYMAL